MSERQDNSDKFVRYGNSATFPVTEVGSTSQRGGRATYRMINCQIDAAEAGLRALSH